MLHRIPSFSSWYRYSTNEVLWLSEGLLNAASLWQSSDEVRKGCILPHQIGLMFDILGDIKNALVLMLPTSQRWDVRRRCLPQNRNHHASINSGRFDPKDPLVNSVNLKYFCHLQSVLAWRVAKSQLNAMSVWDHLQSFSAQPLAPCSSPFTLPGPHALCVFCWELLKFTWNIQWGGSIHASQPISLPSATTLPWQSPGQTSPLLVRNLPGWACRAVVSDILA